MTKQEIVEKALPIVIEANKKLSQKDRAIGFHPLYAESVEMAESIAIHAVKGIFPDKLFKHRSPNQTEKEATYIKENYKQHTLPVFLDYQSTITRPFGDGNWSIHYKEDKEKFKSQNLGFQTYVEKELPKYGSLETFVKGILPSIKSIDANGFLAVRPDEIKYKDNGEGEQVVDAGELYSPTVFYYSSKETIDYEKDEYYIFLSCEKSFVDFNNRKEKIGNVYEVYTKNAVFFYVQEGRKSDNKFKLVEFYRHNLGHCQVEQLKGIPTLKGDEILWQSPFLYATDLLDLVAMNGNFLQALINSCVFPVKVMFGSPCTFRDSETQVICSEGTLNINGAEKICPSCNGIGLKSRVSPLGTLLLNPTTKFAVGEEKATQDPLKYVSPEVHTLDFLDKKIVSDETKARAILHLRTKNSSTKTEGDVTATQVFDDAKGTTAFVMPISNQIFDLYYFLLKCIGEQRYGEDFEMPDLSYPKTCDFKSPEDYLVDIGEAIKNNLPPAFIQLLLLQYINSYYGDNEKSTNIFKLVMSADRLFGLSQDEINMKMARGTIHKWEDILHTSALSFINDSMRADPKFTEKKIEDQIEAIQYIAKAKEQELSGAVSVDIYGTPAIGGGLDNTNTPIDLEAEAKAKLKGSVGGVQGILAIQQQVSTGVTPYSSALAILELIYGIGLEEGKRILGDENEIATQLEISRQQQADFNNAKNNP